MSTSRVSRRAAQRGTTVGAAQHPTKVGTVVHGRACPTGTRCRSSQEVGRCGDQAGQAARSRDHPVRRRLRRRHAAHRRPVHPGVGGLRQRPRRRCRTSPPRSAPPRARCPGVSSFQVHFADHDILTPGDAPDVLVAMNPAALEANLGDLPKGATIIVDTHDFTARNLTKAGYTDEPARGRRRSTEYAAAPGRPDRDDRRGGQGVRPLPQGRRPRQEHVRARAAVVDVRPPDRVDRSRSCEKRFAKVPDIRDANITAFNARLELRRDHRGVRGHLRDQAGADGRRAPTATSPATWRCPTA